MPPRLAATLRWAWCLLPVMLLAPLAMGMGSAEVGADSVLDGRRLYLLSRNSVHMAAVATALAVLWGVPIGLAASRLEGARGRMVLLGLAATPIFLPPPVLAVAAIRLFGPAGWLTSLLSGGVHTFPIAEQIDAVASPLPGAPIYTLWGGGFVLAWGLAPLVALAATVAGLRASRAAEEAALLEASSPSVLARMSLPAALGGVAAGAALVFLLAMTEFGAPESLRSLPVLVSEVYVQFGVYYDTRRAMAASLVLAGLSLAGVGLAAGVGWLLRRGTEREEAEDDDGAPPALGRSAAGRAARALAWGLAIASTGGALGVLVATATGPRGPGAVWAQTWSTAHEELAHSLVLGAAVMPGLAVVGLLVGLALASARRPAPWRLAVSLPLLLPGPVVAIALTALLRQPPGSLPLGLDDGLARVAQTPLPLLAAWTLKFSPIAILLVERAARSVPAQELEAGRLEGAGRLALARAVVWPRAWPALAAGVLAGAALSLGEAGAALLLIPPGTTTLGVRLLTLMHFAPAGEVSALSVMLALPGLALGLLGAAMWTVARRRATTPPLPPAS